MVCFRDWILHLGTLQRQGDFRVQQRDPHVVVDARVEDDVWSNFTAGLQHISKARGTYQAAGIKPLQALLNFGGFVYFDADGESWPYPIYLN